MHHSIVVATGCAILLGWAIIAAASAPAVGVYFDAAGTEQTLFLDANAGGSALVEVFVVLHGVNEPVAGFEAGIHVPLGVQLFTVSLIGTELDGCGFPPWDLNDLHCVGHCGFAVLPPQTIIRLVMFVPTGLEDLVFSIGPAASAGLSGGTAWLAAFECTGEHFVKLEPVASPYGAGAAAINPTGAVNSRSTSWGRIKSLY